MVKRYMESGWPSDKTHISKEYLTFYEKREFLSCEEDILLWNSRIVVPKSLQARILHMLLEGHPGIGSMRALARIYVWWPNIDEDIERYVKGVTHVRRIIKMNRKHCYTHGMHLLSLGPGFTLIMPGLLKESIG